MAGKLTPRQERFVQEYLKRPNATQAAKGAGFSPKTAKQAGTRLLSNVAVLAAIQAGQTTVADHAQVDAASVLRELALIAFSDIGQILDFSAEAVRLRPANDISEAARRAISAFKVKRYFEGHGDDAREVEVTEFKLWSKDAALEKLAKHLRLYVERHEHTGKDGGPIVHDFEALRKLPPDELYRLYCESLGPPGEDRDRLRAAGS